MSDPQIAKILQRLHSREPQQPWAEFLQLYSPLILQVIAFFERDADYVADCFLFVCDHLTQKRFRRLRRYRLKGPASFSTWLRAVVRNLCLDWQRKEFGRQRIFQSIARLPALERATFSCVYEQEMLLDETFLSLRTRFPSLTQQQLAESLERIRQSLTARQLWLLTQRNPKIAPLRIDLPGDERTLDQQIPDTAPGPETLTMLAQQRAALARALSNLSKPERLLLRLRFEQDLTLEELARVTKLGNAQSVDRRIRKIFDRLRKDMT